MRLRKEISMTTMTTETKEKAAVTETAQPKKRSKKQLILNILMYGWVGIIIVIMAIVIGIMSLFD